MGLKCLVGLVSSYQPAFVGMSWLRNFFLWVFCRSTMFSRGYFVGPIFFLASIFWLKKFLSWVVRESKSFSRGYFVGTIFFLVGISWVQFFYSSRFCDSIILSSWIFSSLILHIPLLKNLFQFLQFQANLTSKNAERLGLRTLS